MDPIFIGYLCIIFIVSFVMLVKGADIFIDGAAGIAVRKGVSEHIIGLTLVAFATSIPELAVSDIASYHDVEGIAIGNVVGSNIANIGLVLGVAIVIMPVSSPKKSFIDGVILLAVTVLLYFLLLDGVVGRLEGFLFLIIYAAFIYYLVRRHRDGENEEDDFEVLNELKRKSETLGNSIGKDCFILVSGAAMVLIGAHYLVESAVEMAEIAGVSSLVIGLTIISVGTSLPELSSSVAAALKEKHGISVGNVIGSNLINILLVLGTASIIRPIEVSSDTMNFTMPYLIFMTLITVVLVRTRMPRKMGIVLIGFYGIFLWTLVVRM